MLRAAWLLLLSEQWEAVALTPWTTLGLAALVKSAAGLECLGLKRARFMAVFHL
jgi:hypothetical protein